MVLGFAAELILLPTGLITAAVLTRTLGPRGYGVFSVAATFITWLSLTTTTLLARAAVKFVSETDEWHPVATGVLRWRLVIGAAAIARRRGGVGAHRARCSARRSSRRISPCSRWICCCSTSRARTATCSPDADAFATSPR